MIKALSSKSRNRKLKKNTKEDENTYAELGNIQARSQMTNNYATTTNFSIYYFSIAKNYVQFIQNCVKFVINAKLYTCSNLLSFITTSWVNLKFF